MRKERSLTNLVTITAFIILTLSYGVTHAASAKKSAPQRPNDDNISFEFSQFRRNQVKSVDYEISIKLTKGGEDYSGRTIANVQLAKTNAPLSFDFVGKKIESITVNGKPVQNFTTRTGSFDIPAAALAPTSKIEINYVGAFNKEGVGFQRSIDPEDGAEYFFTDFEPYDAHQFFPCFDQPDLKATYRVQVQAPKDWRAVSNELVESAKTEGAFTTTTFAKTKPFSTYLLFVGAGPFAEWKDQLGETPIYLWARQSLAKHVDVSRIMETTKRGLAFFNDYFGYEYPFSKYGQIFIPEFGSSGMENPGAITLNERFIFRGPVPQSIYEGRDSLILHEMAHMWFGDLVTMKWWNDLWLNESFASYMATISLDRAMNAKGALLRSFNSKGWGYWQDQLVTTHPIETPVPDVRSAKGNFDGITYAKGAASLQQLHFYVGEEGFREGIRRYFKDHAFKNTVREDFISAIAKASNKDLKEWTRAWLKTSGPNRVQAKWSCQDGKLKTFSIEQTPSTSKTLSPHKTRVGLFASTQGGTLRLADSVDVIYSKRSTPVKELIGKSCPEFVYPNVDDHDYALFALDAVSLKQSRAALVGAIESPLLRLQIWSTLAQMVRDGQLPITEYFDTALKGLEAEKEETLLASLLGGNGTIREYYHRFLTPEQRNALAPQFEAVIWNRQKQALAGSDSQMMFYDFYVSIAQTPDALATLSRNLKGEEIPQGLQLDQDRRWNIVKTLASTGATGATALIDAEEKRDASTAGKRHAYAARAAIPEIEVKQKFWTSLEKPESVPSSTLRMASGYFNNWNLPKLTEPFKQPFFERLSSIDWKSNDQLVRIYFRELFPQNLCNRAVLKESETRLRQSKNLTPIARRAWLEANDELKECVSVRR